MSQPCSWDQLPGSQGLPGSHTARTTVALPEGPSASGLVLRDLAQVGCQGFQATLLELDRGHRQPPVRATSPALSTGTLFSAWSLFQHAVPRIRRQRQKGTRTGTYLILHLLQEWWPAISCLSASGQADCFPASLCSNGRQWRGSFQPMTWTVVVRVESENPTDPI